MGDQNQLCLTTDKKQEEKFKFLNDLSAEVHDDPAWGFGDIGKYMRLKNDKLRQQFQKENEEELNLNMFAGDTKSDIFKGVAIHVNGYTLPSHQELRLLMLANGGKFENYFSTERVTHIICSNLPDGKYISFRNKKSLPPIVRPEWIVHCIASNKLLPVDGYLLDRLAFNSPNQRTLQTMFQNEQPTLQYGATTIPPAIESLDNRLPHVEVPSSDSEEDAGQNHESVPLLAGQQASVTNCHVAADEKGDRGPSSRTHSTKDDPNFIQNYYRYSRLHFIGTWRNRHQSAASCPPDKVAAHGGKERVILHVDMDCFFVSVVLRSRPDLTDKPVAVCHSDTARGSSEISSANYIARKYGVTAGMYMKQAKALCPALAVLPYDFEAYERVADQVHAILHSHSPSVQVLSCDEAFLDGTGCGDPYSMAADIRREIMEATNCPASVGIGPNLLIAKLATRKAKPNGQFLVQASDAEDFVSELAVTDLPGVGWALTQKLHKSGVQTCAQLRQRSRHDLQQNFGNKTGDMLFNFCRGVDERPLSLNQQRKSVGAEVNWGVRFSSLHDVNSFLRGLAEEVSSRLKSAGVQGRNFTLKLRIRQADAPIEPPKFMGCGRCDNFSKSASLAACTDDPAAIARLCCQLFSSFHFDPAEVRGVGLHVTRLRAGGSAGTAGTLSLDSMFKSKEAARSESVMADTNLQMTGPAESHGSPAVVHDHTVVSSTAEDEASPKRNSDGDAAMDLDTETAGGADLPAFSREHQVQLESAAVGPGILDGLPPVSQIDPTVMDALPLVLKRELQFAYAQQKRMNEVSSRMEQGAMPQKGNHGGGLSRNSKGQKKAGQIVKKMKVVDNRQRTLWSLVPSFKGEDQGPVPISSQSQAANSSHATAPPQKYDCDEAEVAEVSSKPMEGDQALAWRNSLSMTQIDSQMLAELPASIQEEIREVIPVHRTVMKDPDGGGKGGMEESDISHSAVGLWEGDPPLWLSHCKEYIVEGVGSVACSLLEIAEEQYSGGDIRLSNILMELLFRQQAQWQIGEEDFVTAVIIQYMRAEIFYDLEEIHIVVKCVKRLSKKFLSWMNVEDVVTSLALSLVNDVYGGTLVL